MSSSLVAIALTNEPISSPIHQEFDIHQSTGFAKPCALTELPCFIQEYYGTVIDFVLYKPDCTSTTEDIKESSMKFRYQIDEMERSGCVRGIKNAYNFTVITFDQKKLIYSMLTFMVQKYLRGMGKDYELYEIPAVLGWLWNQCAQDLGIPTAPTYAALVLWNWRWIWGDSQHDLTNILNQIEVLFTVTNLPQEAWFFKIHIAIEIIGAKIVNYFLTFQNSLASLETTEVMLDEIRECLDQITTILREMMLNCDPATFWNSIRLYLSGYDNAPNGVTIKGCPEIPTLRFKGGSGAQSCIFQALDAMFEVKHEVPHATEFLRTQLIYMPAKHRAGLLHMQSIESLRSRLERAGYLVPGSRISQCYNKALEKLQAFRRTHYTLVHKYILVFIRPNDRPNTASFEKEEVKGTGGSSFAWLPTYARDILKVFIYPRMQ